MDNCSNALQSLFSQLTCSNSKIGCDAEAIVLGFVQQIPVPSYNLLCTSPGSSRMVETVRDFLLRLTAVPYVSNLLTQSWMTDL